MLFTRGIPASYEVVLLYLMLSLFAVTTDKVVLFSKGSDKPNPLVKSLRVNQRQCEASDTVHVTMSEPSGSQAAFKNMNNH